MEITLGTVALPRSLKLRAEAELSPAALNFHPRESPSFKLMDLLLERGADLSYNDPHIPTLPKMRHHDVPDISSSELTSEFLAAQDCVLISTDHSAYDFDFIVQNSQLILDTRNATGNVTQGREKIRKA